MLTVTPMAPSPVPSYVNRQEEVEAYGLGEVFHLSSGCTIVGRYAGISSFTSSSFGRGLLSRSYSSLSRAFGRVARS